MDRDFALLGGGFVVAIALLVGGLAWLDSASCHSKARGMRIPSSWGPLQGCIVQYQGTYVPIEAVGVRTIDGPMVPGK